jgi:single-stranded-DNA-specific exonuclease RecJ
MKEYVRKKLSSYPLMQGLDRVTSAIFLENNITSDNQIREWFPDFLGKKSWLSKFIGEIVPIGNYKRFIDFVKIHKADNFCIIGDYDADGIMATTIMKLALDTFGVAKCDYIIPDRLNDGYGIKEKHVDKAISLGAKVIVTVDNGITANTVIDYAKSKGLYVLVTDHHIPDKGKLPNADALINPHLTAEKEKTENICGAFVAFKLAIKLLDLSDDTHINVLKDMALFAAVATISDVMPMVSENRLLVKYVLDNVNYVKNRGIWSGRTLKFLSGFGNGRTVKDQEMIITEDTFGFYIGPTINASGRVNGETEKIVGDIINSSTYGTFINGYFEINKERQTKTREIFKEHKPSDEPIGFMVIDHTKYDYPIGGLIGLVANRIADMEQKPAFIGTLKDNKISFSCRSVPGYSLYEGLNRFLQANPGTKVEGGGHDGAIGIRVSTIEEANVLKEHFIQDFKQYQSIERENVFEFEPQYIDEIFTAHRDLAPFGQGFKKLKFIHVGKVEEFDQENFLVRIDDYYFKSFIKKENLPEVGTTVEVIFSVSLDNKSFDDFKIEQLKKLG